MSDTPEEKPKTGRPSSYTKEIGEAICYEIATSAKSLKSICESIEYPSFKTVFNWLGNEDMTEFLHLYGCAHEARADFLAEEIIEIADTPEEGETTETDPKGKTTTKKGDMLGHRRLQIEARKWAAARLAPKKYGDKIDLTTKGDKIETASINLSHPGGNISLED